MNHNIISYSFVGVWEKPLDEIPLLDKKFCLDLFGDPYNTNSGLINEGFIINYQGKTNPSPSVLISPQRIMILCQDLEMVFDLSEKIKDELLQITNGKFPTKLSACGINTEHEWIGLGMNASDWLSKKFILKGVSLCEGFKENQVKATDVAFQLIVNQDQKMMLLIQPRLNIADGIFVSINHHKDIVFDKYPDRDTLSNLFSSSLHLINKSVFHLLFE